VLDWNRKWHTQYALDLPQWLRRQSILVDQAISILVVKVRSRNSRLGAGTGLSASKCLHRFVRFSGLSFVHAAFSELSECRSFLQHSYAFAFYRYPIIYDIRRNEVVKMRTGERDAFEELQLELEVITEQMSDIVARTHLRATQTQIMSLTCEAAEKRLNLSNLQIAILDNERKEERENKLNENAAQHRSIPPPIAFRGMLARAPVRNEQDDTERDDNDIWFPFTRHRQRTGREIEEEAAMQEAQQASLLSLIAAHEEGAAMQEARQASLRSLIAESQSHETDGDIDEVEAPFAEWSCEACTYTNLRGRTCAMCGTARD
jgi:hypothetical protein